MKKNNRILLEERFKNLSGSAEELFEHSQQPLRKAIRVNTLKANSKNLVSSLESQNFILEKIPWTENGFWIQGIGLSETVEYFLGHYYIQEASSMIPSEILNPNSNDVVLDVCAAPGGKTTHLSALMENQGCLIANEVDPKRRSALRFNLSKYGVLNSAVSSMDFSRKFDCKIRFTKILLDAPCSCEGQFRKNPDALEQWSLNKILKCSKLQKRLISNAIDLLEENGTLVYSTCTLAPEENEEVIDYSLNNFNVKVEPPGIQGFKYRPGIQEWQNTSYNPEVKKCARIHPQDNNSEGFFTAKLTKCGN